MAYPYPIVVQCNPAISSITTSVGGPYAVTNGQFTVSSDAEATQLVEDYNRSQVASQSAGVCSVVISPIITSITINSNVYNTKTTSGQLTVLTGLSAADATALCYGWQNQSFRIANAPSAS
jgi:hypothetical protein